MYLLHDTPICQLHNREFIIKYYTLPEALVVFQNFKFDNWLNLLRNPSLAKAKLRAW